MTSISQLLGRGARGGQEVEKGRRADTDLPPLSHPGLSLRLLTDVPRTTVMWTDVSILAQEPDDMIPFLGFLILLSTFPPRSSTGHDDRDKKDYI